MRPQQARAGGGGGSGENKLNLTALFHCTIDEVHVCGAAVVMSQRLITLRIDLVV